MLNNNNNKNNNNKISVILYDNDLILQLTRQSKN
jgi:hypothetical protein